MSFRPQGPVIQGDGGAKGSASAAPREVQRNGDESPERMLLDLGSSCLRRCAPRFHVKPLFHGEILRRHALAISPLDSEWLFFNTTTIKERSRFQRRWAFVGYAEEPVPMNRNLFEERWLIGNPGEPRCESRTVELKALL